MGRGHSSRGQISTEMIIILAILLAVIVLIATNIQSLVKKNVGQAESEGAAIGGVLQNISGVTCFETGITCSKGSDCCSGSCDAYGKCQ